VSPAGGGRHARPFGPVLAAAAALALVLVLAAGAPPARAQARGAPLRPPQVFLLSSAPDSLADLERHAGSVGIVYPTYYSCETPGGAVTGAPQAAIASYAAARGLRVMPRFNCQDGPTVHRILTEPARRAATLAALVRIATQGANRGVCLDLENDGAEDRQAMSSFVTTLAGLLHARHRRLTVVVVGVTHEDPARSTGFYDDRAIGAAADHVFVLAWGAHWEGSGPGPIAPLDVVRGIARFIASLPDAGRFVIGAPMYALDWPEGEGEGPVRASASQYSEILALARRVGAVPRRDPASQELTFTYRAPDGSRHVVWYMDAHAVDEVLRIGREAGLEVGLWRLGSEDQRVWSAGLLG
jgi:spore germination protein YaaH